MHGPAFPVFATLLLAAWAAFAAPPARAFEITQPIPKSSETACWDVQGAKIANGTPIVAFPCNDNGNEQFQATGAGLIALGTWAGRTTCLGTTSKTGNDLVLIDQCGNLGIFWSIEAGVSGSAPTTYNIANAQNAAGNVASGGSSGKLSVQSTENVTPPFVWTTQDILIAQPIPGTIHNACVDVRGGVAANTTPVDAVPCTLAPNERWTLTSTGELQGISQSQQDPMCLGETSKHLVELQTCTGAPSQTWNISIFQDGTAPVLTNQGSGLVLDSVSGIGPNKQLVDTTSGGTRTQQWLLR